MLKKESFNELKTGWMSPNGDFYPAGYMAHLSVADKIWKMNYGEFPPNDVDMRLVLFGWCEINFLAFIDHGFLFNFYRHLSPEQKNIIKPIFEDNKQRIVESSRRDLERELYN